VSILRRWHGLHDGTPRTLDQIGKEFGVTRERARQLRNRAEAKLREELNGDGGGEESPAVPPEVSHAFRELGQALREHPLLVESEIEAALSESAQRRLTDQDRQCIPLLMQLLGLELRKTDRGRKTGQPVQVWLNPDRIRWPQLLSALSAMDEALEEAETDSGGWMDAEEIVRTMAEASGLPRTRARAILSRLGNLETRRGQRVRVPLATLSTLADRAERVLEEEGAPLHFREILARIRAAAEAHGGQPSAGTPPALASQLSGDPRFSPLGRSGLWKLARWNHVATGTLSTLVESALMARGVPATHAELAADLTGQGRPCDTATVASIVSHYSSRFARVGGGKVALRSWGHPAPNVPRGRAAKREAVRGALLQLGRAAGDDAAWTLKTLAIETSARTGLSVGSCRRLLSQVIPDSGRPIEPRELAAALEPLVRSPLRHRLQEEVRSLLRSKGDGHHPLAQVWREVARTTGASRATIYGAVAEMQDLERIARGRRSFCRLLPP